MFKFINKIILTNLLLLLISCEKREEVHIDKIIFHTSTAFLGKNPSYHLEINKYRTASLIVEEEFKDSKKNQVLDSTKMVYYIGKIDKKTFKALERELYRIDLINLQLENVMITDVSQKSIIVHFNRKKIKIDKTYRSEKLNDLVSILESIYKKNRFTKTDQRFQLEE
jgi:hypothetical protein